MSEGTNSKFSSRSYTQSKYGDESQNTFEPTKEKDREVGKDDIEEKQKLLKQIQTSIIGENEAIHTINGYRKLTYADYTASGRSVSFIENYITNEVLPFYGNTHTSSSYTGRQTGMFREEARALIKSYVNANISKGSDKDVLIFTGSGTTGAIQHIVRVLKLNLPTEGNNVPVVFVGPYEHHSNILPWRESYVELVQIVEDETGNISEKDLEEKLKKYSDRSLKIGSFSAASNVTGILTDTNKISSLLHRYNAFAFWDYASAGPYVKIDMNPVVDHKLAYKDAVFISPHKFVGGVGTPGILIAKKRLFQGRPSSNPGGGTVFYVTEKDHRYVKEVEHREEGGTPDIVGSIRAALAFQLKEAVGEEFIESLETKFCERATKLLLGNPNLIILSSTTETTTKKLPIFSFMISHQGRLLHYNYVCTLLNDLFGIQARGGCACAGPYGQKLLGINYDLSKDFESSLIADDDNEFLRPGFTRISFTYFMNEKTFHYIIDAINFVAEHGWKMLPEYTFYPDTGQWMHRNDKKFNARRWLGSITYRGGQITLITQNGREDISTTHKTASEDDYDSYLSEAHDIVSRVVSSYAKVNGAEPEQMSGEVPLRWFLMPSEAVLFLRKRDVQPVPLALKPMKLGETVVQVEKLVVQVEETTPVEKVLSKKEARRLLFPQVPKSQVITPTKKAIADFDMIKEGDRLLIGVSGGKDSLTMVHTLLALQHSSPVKFTIGACTIDPQTTAYDPSPLKEYFKQLGIPYFFESQAIIERAKMKCTTSICSWCSRMKRGALYNCCRREGYNVLVLAQHLDDLAESFLMSSFHNGNLRTMKANYVNDAGDVKIIRPFVYVRERDIRKWAFEVKLPVISENCPACFEIPKERKRMKTLLSTQELLYVNLFPNLMSAMKPLMEGKLQGSEKDDLKDSST